LVEKPDVDTAHAKRSPSTLKNREQCPGFEPHKRESAAAAEGHVLHRYMELWAKDIAWSNTKEEADEMSIIEGRFTSEQGETVAKLKSWLSPQIKVVDQHDHVYLERKLDLRKLDLPGCDFGTADVLIIKSDDTAILIDYKFGKVEVDDPEENVQFHAYALAVFDEHPNVKSIHVVSLQPRLDVVGETDITPVDKPRLLLRLKTIVERCETLGQIEILEDAVLTGILSVREEGDPFEIPPFNPQFGLCNYCAHVGECPAVAQFALRITDGPAIPEHLTVGPTSTEKDIGELFAWAKILEAKAEAMQASIVELAVSGCEVAGFTLHTRAGRNSLIDPVGFAQDIMETYGLNEEQIYSCSDISLGKIADLIGKATPAGEKQKAMQECKKTLLDGGYFSVGKAQAYLQKNK
jgi:hypothetical protein